MINVIADRYAQALFEVGEETQTTSELYQELSELVDIFNENKDLYNFLKSSFVIILIFNSLAFLVFKLVIVLLGTINKEIFLVNVEGILPPLSIIKSCIASSLKPVKSID